MALTPDQVDELLGAWALDALDPALGRAVEQALADDPALAAVAASCAAVATAFGGAADAAPPPELRRESCPVPAPSRGRCSLRPVP